MCQACGEKRGTSAPVSPPSLRAWYINRTFNYSQVCETYPKEELSLSFQRTYRGIGEARKNQSGKRTQLGKRSVGNLGKNHGSNSENDRSSCTAPEMIPTPQWLPTLKWSPQIPKSTPKWSPFLFTSTPKWSPINSWNGMVFRHGIITSLLQRLRSWIAFNISQQFMWFFSAFVI